MIPVIPHEILEAYRAMAAIGYRPDHDADTYAQAWWEQEDSATFLIGCAHAPMRKAMIYCVEAAKLCCAGDGYAQMAVRLLDLARKELVHQP